MLMFQVYLDEMKVGCRIFIVHLVILPSHVDRHHEAQDASVISAKSGGIPTQKRSAVRIIH